MREISNCTNKITGLNQNDFIKYLKINNLIFTQFKMTQISLFKIVKMRLI